MRPFLLLTLLVFAVTSISNAQQSSPWSCADEQLQALQQRLVPGYNRVEMQQNLRLSQYISQVLRNRKKPVLETQARLQDDSTFTIPVVVHVVYPAGEPYGTGTNVSYAQIRSQLEALNAAYGKNYPAYNGQVHPAYAQNTHIRFCLARTITDGGSWATGPGGTEFGVMRYPNTNGAYNHTITVFSASQLLSITHPNGNRFPFDKYLNIWLVKTIDGGNSVMGYAPRPILQGYPLDGVVMRADIFGDNTTGNSYLANSFGLTQGKVLAHEVGHYLNLYHIFQGGCAGANAAGSVTDACDLNGDMICDIEPATTQNIFCTTAIPNTCTASYATGTTDLDMINDYMSYADDDCMNTFTLNQAQRMWATLNLLRQTLWQPANLVATGVLGTNGCVPPYLNSQINTNNSGFCRNQPVTFSNPTAGNTATTYQWQFPGGSISSATTNTATVSYAATGNYKAILRVSNGTDTRTDSLLFTILDCQLDSSRLHMSHWYFGNYGTIDFTTGTPVQTNTAFVNHTIRDESAYPAQLAFIQGTVSLSDSAGNLLFYSNAVSVWNKNHQKISTTPVFGASDINASTGVCYVPHPGQPGKYFIVGASANLFVTPAEGVKFAEVDLNTNTVAPYQAFQHATLPAKLSALLTVVPHCNGTDYWIIAHGYDTDAKFYAFLVTAAGINPLQAPVISVATHPAYQGSGNQLKASRWGNKLVLCSPHGGINRAASLYDFNNLTGEVKNETAVPNVPGYNNIQTGSAFSPNGDYFYLMRSSDPSNGRPYWLFQYRVSDLQYNIINAPGFYFAAPFQPGPDNQLYVTTQEHLVSRISNPDTWGGVTVNGSFLNMRLLNDSIRTGVSIPCFIDARQPQPSHPDFSIYAVNCNTFRFTNQCFDNYTATWNFGDGPAMQTGNPVTHNYTRPGDFTVILTLSRNGVVAGSTSKNVRVSLLTAVISGPDIVCTNGNYATQYFGALIPNATYKWVVSNGRISGPDDLPYVNTIWGSTGGIGRIELQINKDSCILFATKTVTVTKGATINWVLPDSACIADSSFALSATPAGGVFTGPGVSNNRFSPRVAGLGTHQLAYTYYDESACPGRVEKALKVSRCNIPVPDDQNAECAEILRNVTIAPNPVGAVLQLKSVYALPPVQVYNSLGQKVAAGRLINNSLRLPVLAAGLYLVRVSCGNSYRSIPFLKAPL